MSQSKMGQPPVRLLALAGDISPGSRECVVLELLARLVPPGARLETLSLDDVPFFTERDFGFDSLAVRRLKRAIRSAGALLVVTDEHNASVPAALKNALDWASRPYFSSPLSGKPCVLVGVSGSPGGGQRALRHLREILVAADATPVGAAVALGQVQGRLGESAFGGAEIGRLELVLSEVVDSVADRSQHSANGSEWKGRAVAEPA